MEAVRPAIPDDEPACAELLNHALDEVSGQRGGPALVAGATTEAVLAAWRAPDAGVEVFVGEFHEVAVGLVAVRTFTRPGAAEPTGLVECCYVEREARGVGVGSALMDAAVEWCAGQGCADVDARALPGDRSTKQRLEAAGFTARLLTLNRRLR